MSLLRSNPETKEFANDLPQNLQQDLGRVEFGRTYTVTAPTSRSWTDIRNRYNREQIQRVTTTCRYLCAKKRRSYSSQFLSRSQPATSASASSAHPTFTRALSKSPILEASHSRSNVASVQAARRLERSLMPVVRPTNSSLSK